MGGGYMSTPGDSTEHGDERIQAVRRSPQPPRSRSFAKAWGGMVIVVSGSRRQEVAMVEMASTVTEAVAA